MKRTILIVITGMILTLSYGQDKVFAPTLVSPANNAVNQMADALLDWTAVAGAQTYEIQYDADMNFTAPVIITTSFSATNASVLKYNTVYYWRVRANGATPGDISPWSSVWSFLTKESPDPVLPKDVITTTPPFDTLKFTYDLSTFFKWVKITGSSNYTIEIDTVDSFTSPYMISSNSADVDTSILSTHYYGHGYYFRVQAYHSQDISSWSAACYFSTMEKPVLEKPQPQASGNPNLNVSPVIQLQWDGILGSDLFQYEYSVDSTFATSTIIDVPLSAQIILNPLNPLTRKSEVKFPADTLPYGEKIFWRARSFSSSDTSLWSDPYWLTTIAAPLLNAPANGGVNVSLTPNLIFTQIPGSLEYQLQVSKQSNFANLHLDTIVQHTTGSTITVSVSPKLDASSVYYWRVKAFSSRDISDWGQASFTTQTDVSIPAFNPENSFNFYPNPTAGKLTVEFNSPSSNEYSIEISNIIGKTVLRKSGTLNSGDNKIQINLNEFENGIYFLSFTVDKYKVTRKIILSK